MLISGKARLAGVMGWPVSHSRSPLIHGYWLNSLGIDGAYLPLPVTSEDLALVLQTLPKMGFVGVNVTVPHKERVIDHLAIIDPLAKRIGAVNTLIWRENIGWEGLNSDAFGFLKNLQVTAPQWSPKQGTAVVLGAGGAARAILVALLDQGVPEIRLLNRSAGRAEKLAAELDQENIIKVMDWNQRSESLKDASLLVNTTILGMTGQLPLDISLDALPTSAVVNDIVYAPLMTPLLVAAHGKGNPIVDGLGMLLWQAASGFEAWFGLRPDVTPELREFVLSA